MSLENLNIQISNTLQSHYLGILHIYSNITAVAGNIVKQLLGSAFRVRAWAIQKQQCPLLLEGQILSGH